MSPGIYNRILLVILLFLFCSPLAKALKTTIVYDSSTAVHAALYQTVIEGITLEVPGLEKIQIQADTSVDNIVHQLDQFSPDCVIALDEVSARLVKNTAYRERLLAGLFFFGSSDYKGVNLALSSADLADSVRRLIPTTQRVFIVQQKGHTAIIDTGHVKSVSLLEGHNEIETLRLLNRVIEQDANETDAVFIPANISDDMLFKIGLTAWDRNIKLFSTNVWHFENGILMVFYPDALELGKQLGQMAKRKHPALETVKIININLNKKVAQHVGLKIAPPLLSKFKVIIQ